MNATANSKPSFVYVTYIATSPEKVWQALTKPDISEKYWFGYRVQADGGDLQLALECATIERLDVLQLVAEGQVARVDLVMGQGVEHEGIVGVRAVADCNHLFRHRTPRLGPAIRRVLTWEGRGKDGLAPPAASLTASEGAG